MRDIDQLIELAMRHVKSGRQIVERERELIASGRIAPGAVELLATFEKTQAIFEDDLGRFLTF
jgi:hypothetical protein